MKFAVLGEHPDALALSATLTATGRHECVRRADGDIEELLADPTVVLAIVAGTPTTRPALLRRALQSERAVVCVHPADEKPDLAYEAALIQADTRQPLVPLLVDALHPAVDQLAGFLRALPKPAESAHLVWEANVTDVPTALPIWPILRQLAGEVVEVSAFAAAEERLPDRPLLIAGIFENRMTFQATFFPGAAPAEIGHRLRLFAPRLRAELVVERGWEQNVRLWCDGVESVWTGWCPWEEVARVVEAALADPGKAASLRPTWQDEIRCLELDDAATRSLERRRSSTLDYQEASEEVGFKGAMTLVGCAMLWLIVVAMIASAWQPWIGWVVLPALALFLVLQLLRGLIPKQGR